MESGKEGLSKDTYVAVNIKTKKIIALEVTDEKIHDGKVIKQLIEQVLNNNHNIKIKSFLGDGASYDSNENFKYLKEKKRIQPIIKVKRNSIISTKRITKYGIEKLISNKEDYHKWKKKRKEKKVWTYIDGGY